MALKVRLVVPVFSPPEWITRCVRSAAGARAALRVDLHLHAADAATRAACSELATRADVALHAHGENRGLSRTWNDGLLAGYADGADVVIIANDDVEFAPGDVDRLAEAAAAQRDRYIVSCAGPHGRYGQRMPSHGFSCFAINPIALEEIGCFDENFFPAYCEDQDYSRRARLAGLHEANCPDTEVFHAGSTAILSDDALRLRNAYSQALNMRYYRRKWGGDGDHEQYAHPFADPRIGIRIAPEQRSRPYGTRYDREDRR
jgi:GT2 family glycosyltransferase